MPTPPKETIGGTRPHHIIAHEFALETYNYAIDLSNLKTSEEWAEIPVSEQELINQELDVLELLNELQNKRIDDY